MTPTWGKKSVLSCGNSKANICWILEDAVVGVKDEKGTVKLHQAVNLTATGAVSGGFWGTLIGLIFLNPTARLVGCCPSSRHILLASNSLAGAHDFPIPSEAAHDICGLVRETECGVSLLI